MTDWRALLNGVLAAPDDDLARLVYADWLEEHGEADRARFIREQIALANFKMKRGDETQDVWERSLAAARLLENNLDWVLVDPGEPFFKTRLKGDGRIDVEYESMQPPSVNPSVTMGRGFAEKLFCWYKLWQDFGPVIVSHDPVVRVNLCDAFLPSAYDEGFFWARDMSDQKDPASFGQIHDDRAELPHAIFDLMEGTGYSFLFVLGIYHDRRYKTEEAAFDDLSLGLLKWAKREAVRQKLVPDLWGVARWLQS